jgi:serine/threonine protein kinase
LGKGGFSVVSEIQGVQLDEVYDTSDHEMALRKDFSAKVEDEQRHFVIKMLRTDLPEDEHAKGVVDLAIEAEFLKSLSHDNIITMRAHANSDPHESRFFVVLDKLVITLERKMNFWRKEVSDNAGYWMGPCVGYCCSRRHVLHRLWMERLMVSRDIGLAIRYLHSQKICYRDLVRYLCGVMVFRWAVASLLMLSSHDC